MFRDCRFLFVKKDEINFTLGTFFSQSNMPSFRNILLLCLLALSCSRSYGGDNNVTAIDQKISALNLNKEDITIWISKLSHTLTLKIDTIVLKQYVCVFGGNPVDDKSCEGDQCTPEGVFHIKANYPLHDWEKFMWIDYPNRESERKFETNKQLGRLPQNARIGGNIGIHGVPAHKSYLIDELTDWTLGCISLRNEDILEIYSYVGVGTEVIITK